MSNSLRALSDREILSRVHQLTRQERSLTLSVLLHLNEIERRKLHLKQGYASMFDYCTAGLGYASSAAARRIRAARCMARFPEVYGLLKANEVNVSTVSQVARILNATNKDILLARIRGRSQREVEAVVAEYQPRSLLREIVRPVVLRVATASAETGTPMAKATETDAAKPTAASSEPSGACEKSAYCRSGSATHTRDESPARPDVSTGTAMRLERRTVLQFSASEAFMAKLEKVRSLAWHRLPSNPSLEQVFELALDLVIEKHDPRARQERRHDRPRASAVGAGVNSQDRHGAPDAPASRCHIPARVRDEVFVKDQGRCTFTGANGRRCGSTHALQVDHVTPVARGGPSTPDNLRLLCAYHNRLEAERMLGTAPLHRSGSNRPPAR